VGASGASAGPAKTTIDCGANSGVRMWRSTAGTFGGDG
jgi:hypothetical protein